METLRMWNVATIVFARVTTFDDSIKGSEGKDVEIPAGTKFTLWNYASHHSTALWGEDAMRFNPDREWQPEELQRSVRPGAAQFQGTAMTPCTERFHPFSVPRRDCLGKGFALTEMRILIPRIIRAFRIEIGEGSGQDLSTVLPHVGDSLYCQWCREIGGPPQPHALHLKVTPLDSSQGASRL